MSRRRVRALPKSLDRVVWCDTMVHMEQWWHKVGCSGYSRRGWRADAVWLKQRRRARGASHGGGGSDDNGGVGGW
jgi:hypothetical protein